MRCPFAYFKITLATGLIGRRSHIFLLKPFDLEAAKAGKPVCTRDGRKARIISFDRKFLFKGVSYPIIALVEDTAKEETVYGYNEKGKVTAADRPWNNNVCKKCTKKEKLILLRKLLLIITRFYKLKIHVRC